MRNETDLVRPWRTSSYSGTGNNCVEVAQPAVGAVAVRDSKDRRGPELVFRPAQWRRFAARVKAGRFGVA